MPRTVLLTLGRLPKALDFARAFHAAGWRVVVAEPFRRHLTGASRSVTRSIVTPAPRDGKAAYLDALARIVRDEAIDLVLPLSEETLHVAHLRAHAAGLPDATLLFAPPAEVLLELHDKQRFIAVCDRLGLAAPETHRLGTPQAQTLADACDTVIKPIFSCSGRGVGFVQRGDALAERSEPCIVQRHIVGHHRSTFSIVHDGHVQTTVVYRGTVMSGSVAVAFERVEEPALLAWVAHFAASARWDGQPYSGFLSFDFIIDAAGTPYAIECNPRVTSGVHFLDTRDLVPAILTPFAQPVRFGPHRRMQQLFPTLTETQASITTPRRYIANLRTLMTSRDVSWDWRDPLPLLGMPVTAFGIIALAVRQRKSFGEVSTDDIAWFEGG